MTRKTILSVAFTILLTAAFQSAGAGVKGIFITDPSGKRIGGYENSHALVIGVSDYGKGWPDLPGVKADIKAVRTALEKHGFSVVMLKDPTRKELRETIDRFISQHGRNFHDRVLIYYAGHGYTLKQKWGGNMGYIVPSDAPSPRKNADAFMDKAIDMQQIEVYAKRIQSKHALFVFDSCFSGSIFSLSRDLPGVINYKTSMPVRQFITAGSAHERVPDQSIFRQQFEAALEGAADANKDGYVTGSELGEFLQTTVVNYSREMQHPQYGKIRHAKLDKGDFVFILDKKKPASPEAEKQRIVEEKERLPQETENLEQEKKLLAEQKTLGLEKEKLEADRYADLEGIWEDEDGYQHTIQRNENQYTVVSVVGLNGKPCEITGAEWRPGVLKWAFHVPWSGHTLRYSTKSIGKNKLECDWNGPDGSGTDILRRFIR